MKCATCPKEIEPERVEFLPHTRICSICARTRPEPARHDPNEVCAKASLSCSNGFAPNDTPADDWPDE